jgi:hypothetical protein
MLKYILAIFSTALLGFAAGLYLPWWSIALAALLVSVTIPQRPGFSFVSGFLGIFLVWEVLAWLIDFKNDSILSQKVAALLGLGHSSILMIFVTALVGALVGGMAALTGSYLRRTLFPARDASEKEPAA